MGRWCSERWKPSCTTVYYCGEFRCSLLHRRTKEEAYTCQLSIGPARARNFGISRICGWPPFILQQDLRHIFLTPLAQRLEHDADGLQCFLSTYNIGKETQALEVKRQSNQAKFFFFPRGLPITLNLLEEDEISNLSIGVSSALSSRSDAPSSSTVLSGDWVPHHTNKSETDHELQSDSISLHSSLDSMFSSAVVSI